jgi:hypothetical protein
MRVAIGESLVRIAYALFLVLVAFAVADYGLTRADSLLRFQLVTFVVVGLWLAGCLIATRWPRTGWVPWVGVIGLVVLGYGKVAIFSFLEHEISTLSPIGLEALAVPDSIWARLRVLGTVDVAASLRAAGTAAAVCAGFLMAIEIWRDYVWSRALLLWMLTIGFTITVLFFLQRFIGEPFQVLNLAGRPTSFFTYNYWGNGAAFLNLFWPVALGVTLYCGIQRSRFWTIWFFPPLIIFSAVFFNISKAGNVLAAGGLLIVIVLAALPVVRMIRECNIRIRKSYLLAIVIPAVAILGSCYFAIPWNRWDSYLGNMEGLESDTRYRANAQFVRMIPDAGWTGFGPGTFEGLHLGYLKDHPDLLKVPFWTAHQDYIQTLVEWGWIGTALWAFIMVPGVLMVLVGIFKRVRFLGVPRHHYGWGMWDPIRQFFLALPEPNQPLLLAGVATSIALVAAHAAGDFPFQVPSLGLYFLVWVAMGWSLMLKNPDPDEDDEQEN